MVFRVIKTDKKIGNGKKGDLKRNGYIGMNRDAARSLRIPYPYGKNTILVYRNMPKEKQKRTIIHEIAEQKMMDDNGPTNWGYKKAHQAANAVENADFIVPVRGNSNRRASTRKNMIRRHL